MMLKRRNYSFMGALRGPGANLKLIESRQEIIRKAKKDSGKGDLTFMEKHIYVNPKKYMTKSEIAEMMREE